MSNRRRPTNPLDPRPPVLPLSEQGGAAGQCIVCFRGTDSGIGVRGDLEWMAAALFSMGVPKDQAIITIAEYGPDLEDGGGQVAFRWCRPCADKVPHFPRPVLIFPGCELPTIVQPA